MHSISPLIAYLKALRGKISPSSGSLDLDRVSSFGLPYRLPSDDPRNEGKQRAKILLDGLKAAIQKLESPDREIAHHYFFGTGDVEERNRAVVAALGPDTSPSKARNYQGRALESVARYLLEPDATDIGPSNADLVNEVVRAISPAYPANSSLEQLARMILPNRPAIEATEITLTMRDADDSSLYNLLIASTVPAPPGNFYLALTPRATLSDLVVNMCPRVSEVFACSNSDDVQGRAEEWTQPDRVVLTASGQDAQGLTTRIALPLEILSDIDKTDILKGLPKSAIDDIVVLAAHIPDTDEDNSPTPVELKQLALMERRDHYCYWLADRPTFVKRITVDWSSLTLLEGQEVRLRPTIRATAYEARHAERSCVLDIGGWLVAGQGILIAWG